MTGRTWEWAGWCLGRGLTLAGLARYEHRAYRAVMNTSRYARVTLVLDRHTDEGLAYLSRRLDRSKSELVRDVLEEPVRGMVGVLQRFPDGAELDPRQLALAGLEMIESVVDAPIAQLRGVANGVG